MFVQVSLACNIKRSTYHSPAGVLYNMITLWALERSHVGPTNCYKSPLNLMKICVLKDIEFCSESRDF